MLFWRRRDTARRGLVETDSAKKDGTHRPSHQPSHQPWRLSAKLLIASSVATVIGFSAICANVMLDMRDGSRRTAIGIAVSRRCDLLVAVAQGRGDASKVRRAALEYLGSGEMTRWMMAAMDGG